MNHTYKFHWLALIAFFLPLFLFAGILFVSWLFLAPGVKVLLGGSARVDLICFLGATGLLMIGLGFTFVWILHHYIFPVKRLVEETELIRSGNPSHRTQAAGGPELRQLADFINEFAEKLESKQRDLEKKIIAARSQSETEKNILAAFMAELPQGILICNLKGKILLYNRQAKLFLSGNMKDPDPENAKAQGSHQFVGLGRWINDIIDPYLTEYAFGEIKTKLNKGAPDAAAYFVISQNQRLMKVETAPILDHLKRLTGFVLIFYDITDQIQTDSHARFLWQSLTHHVRSSVTIIRSAIESLRDYPDLTPDRREKLEKVVHEEALSLGKKLDEATNKYQKCCADSHWPLVSIRDRDLVDIICKRAEEKIGLEPIRDVIRSTGWVRVDTYSMTLACLYILEQLKRVVDPEEISIRLKKAGHFIGLDFLWDGPPVSVEKLNRWVRRPVVVGREKLPFTLEEIMAYHQMDIGSYPGRTDTDPSHIRIFIPAFTEPEPVRKIRAAILPESRPEFFDFDLFHQLGQNPEVDNRRLDELTYTVFDMETTGLDISGEDRIVSIGAVRIVNAKLLREERFHQLVDPRRPIPAASTEFHGITDDMVAGQPVIQDVLPLFYRFAEETVLVAHNAAFDMRLLQINERYTGLKFINPVLDTLLLSAVVHPSLGNHDLEAIAERLGVPVESRHTALGDALTTAGILLKLIPLLAQRGIYTLKEARNASRRTYLSRLKY